MKKAADKDPVIIESDRAGYFEQNGHRVEVAIYRLETEYVWTLEVIDEHGTSTVWDDPFDTEEAAWAEFVKSIAEEGVESLVEPIAREQLH